jgi:UDP-GlcNAc:undecaprenyl-phosphate/decaprenyl-phosphate GlcNAc-1-phosphate transferase
LLRRAKGRAGLTIADKGHLHHRLLRLGHGHRRTVLILWAWTGLLSALVLIPVYTGKGTSFVPLGVVALGLFLYTIFGPGMLAKRPDVSGVTPTEIPGPETSEAQGVTPGWRDPASARRAGGA